MNSGLPTSVSPRVFGVSFSTSRTQNAALSIVTGFLFTAVSVSTSLLATPWLLRWLGAECFGAYKLLTDGMGYIALLDLGLSGALMAYLAQTVAQNDGAGIRRLITAGAHAYVKAMPLMIAGGVALALALPHFVTTKTLTSNEIRIAGLISLLPVLLTPLLVFRSLAEARQHGYVIGLVIILQSVLTTGLLLAAAWAGWGLVGQSLAGAVGQLPATLILLWDGIQVCRGSFSVSSDQTVTQALWSLSRPTFVHTLTDRIGLLSDNLIIAWFLGPIAVVVFHLTQQLSVLAQFLLRGLGNATWAGLVELDAQGQRQVFCRRLLELTGTLSALSLAGLAPIAAYNHHFVARWVCASSYGGDGLTIIACINVWFWSIYSLWGWPLLGTGNIGRWAPYAIVFAIVNVTVSILGTLAFGVVGPLLGTLIGFLVINSWALPKVLHEVFGLSPSVLWRTALAPLPWALLYAGILWLLARTHVPWGWLGLALEMGFAVLGGLFLWWTLTLDESARTQWRYRLRTLGTSY